MNCKEIVRDIMKKQGKSLADVAGMMKIQPTALRDRLKTRKIVKGKEVKTLNITVAKLNNILCVLVYEIAIVPRGKINRVEGAYVISDTDGIKMSEVG